MNSWKQWVISLLNAGVSGLSTGIITMYLDPAAFNLQAGMGKLFFAMGLAAFVSMAKWAAQHPLPGVMQDPPSQAPPPPTPAAATPQAPAPSAPGAHISG